MKNHSLEIQSIENSYNPENDVATPRVSWTEYALLEMVKDLLDSVETLQANQEGLHLAIKNILEGDK